MTEHLIRDQNLDFFNKKKKCTKNSKGNDICNWDHGVLSADVLQKFEDTCHMIGGKIEKKKDVIDSSNKLFSVEAENISMILQEANLSQRIEEYVRFKSYCPFLSTETLISLSSVPGVSDKKFLAGACIGLTHDLEQYAVERDIECNLHSVEISRDITDYIIAQLLKLGL